MSNPDEQTCEEEEENPILEELWRIKEERFAAYGYDIRRMMKALRRRQYLLGIDLYGRDASGEIVLVFKGSGKRDPSLDETID